MRIEVKNESLELLRKAVNIAHEEIRVAVKRLNAELILELGKQPEAMYELSSGTFEELVAELLEDMGYDVKLTPRTRDGGRDIIAVFKLPHADILTIVDCKHFAKHRKIGPDIVQRLLWVADRNDKASQAMLVTTSSFTSGSKIIEKEYKWKLSLKDFNDIKVWLSQYGKWQSTENPRLWLPDS